MPYVYWEIYCEQLKSSSLNFTTLHGIYCPYSEINEPVQEQCPFETISQSKQAKE